jgi:hypothetical protein
MLSRALDVVKKNPWKITLGTVATVLFSVVGVFFSDARYEFKKDAEREKEEIRETIKELQKKVEALTVQK